MRDSYVNFIPVATIVGHCAVAETNVKLDYRIDSDCSCSLIKKCACLILAVFCKILYYTVHLSKCIIHDNDYY